MFCNIYQCFGTGFSSKILNALRRYLMELFISPPQWRFVVALDQHTDFRHLSDATLEKPGGNPDQFGSSVDSVKTITDTKPNVIASSDGSSVDRF